MLCAEKVENHTLLLTLKHEKASGVLELSTGSSWCDARESLTVNTHKGIYEMEQMESLQFRSKQSTLMGVPIEKVLPKPSVRIDLLNRNNFVPTIQNNQIVTQGYFHTIKSFVDAVEGGTSPTAQSLESMIDTYSLLEAVRASLGINSY